MNNANYTQTVNESAPTYRIYGTKDSQYVQVHHPFPEVMQHAADLREGGWDVSVELVGMPERRRSGQWTRIEGVRS